MNRMLILFSFLLLLSGCFSGKKIRKKDIIPRNDLVSVLEDIHLANGFFSMSYLRNKYPGTDSISNYSDILAHYGYTLKDFNNTVVYYLDHFEEYEQIYEQVIKDLNEMEEKTFNMPVEGPETKKKTDNLWNRKTEWHLPREGQRNKIPFSIHISERGVYTLMTRIRINREDESVRPAITVYFWYDDGTEEGHKIFWKKKRLVKDGNIRQYILSRMLTDPKVTHIKGFILNDENKGSSFIKYADILDIKLDVKPLHIQPEREK